MLLKGLNGKLIANGLAYLSVGELYGFEVMWR
jgi:hypothetical protein